MSEKDFWPIYPKTLARWSHELWAEAAWQRRRVPLANWKALVKRIEKPPVRRAAIAILIGLLVLAGPALALVRLAAAEDGLVVEKTMLPVKTIDGVFELEAMIVRPPGPGPFPLAW